MDAGKRQGLRLLRGANDFRRVAFDAASAKMKVFVKEQMAAGFALLHGQGGEGLIFDVSCSMRSRSMVLMTSTLCSMKGSRTRPHLKKEPAGLFQAAAGIEQHIFA